MPGKFSNREKAKAAQREVSYRRKVYRHLVEHRGMKQEKADYGISIMEEIAADYDRLAETDEKGERLL